VDSVGSYQKYMLINTTRIAGTKKPGLSFKIVESRPILIVAGKDKVQIFRAR